jgi:thiosulfate dehydrogenase
MRTALAVLCTVLFSLGARAQSHIDLAALPPWHVPDIAALPHDEAGEAIRYGRDLLRHTSALIGPDAQEPAMRFAGNGLECQSCHLEAGTVRFGLPLVGIWSLYPAFSARVNATQTLADRINDCMLRSMNGRPLPQDSREMKAIEAYIKFLGSEQPNGFAPVGRGSPKLPLPDFAANPARGKAVYQQVCAACHHADGQGVRYSPPDARDNQQRYLFPPLWGSDSYNDGAGMAHVIAAAWFAHANMPRGVTFAYPILKPEQAYDVAAYIDSQPRPRFQALTHDYPDPWLKPADVATAPVLGPFPIQQHKFGPWQPIEAWMRAHTPASEHGARSAGDLETTSDPAPAPR